METKKQKLNKWQKAFEEDCLKRDEYKCRMCGTEVLVSVHRINPSIWNHGLAASNGITLCTEGNNCQLKANKYHDTKGVNWEPGFHPDDLYQKIGVESHQASTDCYELSNKREDYDRYTSMWNDYRNFY